MAQISTNEFKVGVKIEIDKQPYVIVSNQFVKPGKGQAFNRTKIRNLLNGRTIEKTFKSGETFDLADILETKMRMLYKDTEGVVFMDDENFEQLMIVKERTEAVDQWLVEDLLYDIVFYKGEAIAIEPPMFLELKIVETAPGARGDTASGRVLKPAVTESGADIQVPIFINEGEVIKVDTRTGKYVERVSK